MAGESIEGEAGVVPVDLNLNLGDVGSAKSDSTLTSTFSQSFGGKNIASGSSSAGNIGLAKSVALAILLITGYAVYAYFAREKGKK